MITHKKWVAVGIRKRRIGSFRDKWLREGWFLFGFIPLYVRDLEPRRYVP